MGWVFALLDNYNNRQTNQQEQTDMRVHGEVALPNGLYAGGGDRPSPLRLFAQGEGRSPSQDHGLVQHRHDSGRGQSVLPVYNFCIEYILEKDI